MRRAPSVSRLACGLLLLALPAAARASSLWCQENGPAQHDYGRQLVIPPGFGAGEFTFELWVKPDHTYPVGPVAGGTDQLRNWSNVDNPPYSALDWWYSGNFLLDGHNNASFTAGTFSLQFYGGGRVRWAAIALLSQYEDYKGLLDEMRFWSRAKSTAEIQGGWRAPAPPGSPGLVGLYRFSEGSGTTACSAIAPSACHTLVNMRPGYWSAADAPLGAGSSLRYYGNGAFQENQVKIGLDGPAVPADIGAGDFTLEFWMKALPGENTAPPCTGGGYDWINGDIAFDRDVYGNGDYGDYGMSLADGRVSFGVGGQQSGGGYFENTVCGTRLVADGGWHHLALVRSTSPAQIRVYVDGQLDASGPGPSGDTSYRNGRATSWPGSDPFLVIGAEKHFGADGWSGFSGWIDEVRLSTLARYSAGFTPPTAPFATDAQTAALYHFDEGGADAIADSSGAAGGPSPGIRYFGGGPAGPAWSADTPFAAPPAPTRFYPLPPCRLADTRGPAGPSGGPALGANTARAFPVSGLCGVPPTAVAVAVNATAVGPTDAGNLRLYPDGSGAPNASSLNFARGRTRANGALLRLGTGGRLTVQCDMTTGSTGSTHFVLDVAGYFQ